jgi:ABC-2 type transport system permease protein
LPEAPDWLLARIDDPMSLRYIALESGAAVQEGIGLIVWGGTPVLLAFIFALSVFTGSNQLGTSVVREKDQRAMEMVITSIRPRTLVAGKVLGMTLVSLTQLGIWALGGGIAVSLVLSRIVDASTISMRWEALIWALLLGIPGYFLYAFIGAGLGIIAGDHQQARQLSGLLGMLGLSPLYLVGVLVSAPDGPLAVFLSLFPLTAPAFSLIRMTLTNVPLWQLIAGLGLILISLMFSLWAVTRVFRAAMLLHGQRLAPKEIWRALRGSG